MTWRDLAACKGRNPDDFMPGRGDMAGVAAAKAVCAHCTVRNECLEYALAFSDLIGVWGGCSELERQKIRERRRRAVRPVIPYGSLAVTVDVGTVVATAAHALGTPRIPDESPTKTPTDPQ